jgi:tetratricopeptide (TPR) repeat protein
MEHSCLWEAVLRRPNNGVKGTRLLGISVLAFAGLVRGIADDNAVPAAQQETQALAAFERHDYRRAAGIYRGLLQQAPEDPRWLDKLAIVLHLQGKSSEAVGILRQLIQMRPSAHSLALLAVQYCQLGEYDQAHTALVELKNYPQELGIQSLTARCSLSAAAPLDAVAIYQDLVDRKEEPEDEFAVGLARAYIQASGRILQRLRTLAGNESFVRAVDEARKTGSPDARAAFDVALPRVPFLRLDMSPQEFSKVLDAHRDDPAVAYIVGVLCGERGLEAFSRCQKSFPASAELRLFKVEMYTSAKRYEDAVEELRGILRDSPKMPGIHYQLATLYLSHNALESALAEFREQLRVTPDDERAIEGASTCLEDLGMYAELYTQLKSFVAASTSPGWALVRFGIAAKAQGHAGEAVQALERARQLNPKDQNVHYRLWRLYLETGEDDKARTEHEAFIQLNAEKRRNGK